MALELPRWTSASQLVCYAMCPRKYAFSYLYGAEPEFRSTAPLLGSAVHSALGWWFERRLAGESPSYDDAEQIVASDLFASTVGSTPVRWKEATEASLENDARRLTRLYLKTHGELPVIRVEEEFVVDLADPDTGEVGGRPFKGFFDLLLEDDRIVELKTTARGWNDADLVRHLQVGGYAFAYNALHGGPSHVEVHTIVKLKREPRVDVFTIERGEAQTRWWFAAASAIERAIDARIFPPAPGPLCHECEFESACAAWTGQAPEPRSARRLPLARAEAALASDL